MAQAIEGNKKRMEKIRQSDEFFQHNNANMKSKDGESENEEEENYDFEANDQTFEDANGKKCFYAF